jgi:hypothetical protein
MFLGAQMVQSASSPNKTTLDPQRALQVEEMVRLVEAGRAFTSKVVIGSKAPGPRSVWKPEMKYLSLGFEVVVGTRSKDAGGKQHEDHVDELLHCKIATVLLDPDNDRKRNTVVLLTGDGNSNNAKNNFPFFVSAALKRGWRVEMWAWKVSCSRIYRDMYKQLPQEQRGMYSLRYLDGHPEVLKQKIPKLARGAVPSTPSKKEEEEEGVSRACMLCDDRERSVEMLPCGHSSYCRLCFTSLMFHQKQSVKCGICFDIVTGEKK